jgi:photosynthetic reaction center cytochrome c subunit
MSSATLRNLSLAALVMLVASACERPPVDVVQHGYRGTGMDLVYNPRIEGPLAAANQAIPAVSPPAEPGGVPATAVYKNIQVLTDLNVAQLTRVMLAITAWVAPPGESCNYCHSGADLASDDNYRKVVSRQMLRMVRHLNSDWQSHVAGTGVTCYTCHRGNDVPQFVWYKDPGPLGASDMMGNRDGHNAPTSQIGYTALPSDPFEQFLANHPANVRVVATAALPDGNASSSIKTTEQTYALMMHISQALGVNCTYCHNTRSFTSWDSSSPQRAAAWYGIRMVRDVNENYLEPLTSTFPANRKGPLADVAKVNCQTCHQGVFKPLYGVSMLKDYPELSGAVHAAATTESADGKTPVASSH